MAEIPSGHWSLALTNLQELLANVTAFQTWVGEITPEAAKDHIYLIASESAVRPFALISQGDAFGFRAIGGGVTEHYYAHGSLKLRFSGAVSTPYINDAKNAELEYTNAIGAILQGMVEMSGEDAYMLFYNLDKIYGPQRNARDERNSSGEYFDSEFNVPWGP